MKKGDPVEDRLVSLLVSTHIRYADMSVARERSSRYAVALQASGYAQRCRLVRSLASAGPSGP